MMKAMFVNYRTHIRVYFIIIFKISGNQQLMSITAVEFVFQEHDG